MNATWMPCSGLESFDDMVWLPRLVQKARRYATSDGAAMNGYLYGDNDFIDRRVLDFLRIDDAQLGRLVRELEGDDAVARAVIERSGRSPDERRAYSRKLRRQLFDFVLLEADEGRLPPGFKRSVIRFLYNRVMMPPINAAFRRAERKRSLRET
ncbi:MAG: DUF5069 domain-containing protein [Candidatus Velthaea sp.]